MGGAHVPSSRETVTIYHEDIWPPRRNACSLNSGSSQTAHLIQASIHTASSDIRKEQNPQFLGFFMLLILFSEWRKYRYGEPYMASMF